MNECDVQACVRACVEIVHMRAPPHRIRTVECRGRQMASRRAYRYSAPLGSRSARIDRSRNLLQLARRLKRVAACLRAIYCGAAARN